MSVISKYQFIQGYFNGICPQINQPSNDETFSAILDNIMYTVHRPNAEFPVHIGPLINTDANVGKIAKQLIAAKASLTSDLRVQAVLWPSVPYFMQHIGSHLPNAKLIKISFDLNIDVPVVDLTGTVSIYLFAFLDSQRHLQVRVDGTWVEVHGLFGVSAAAAALKAAMPAVRKQVEDLLPPILEASKNITFAKIYYLPGNGTRAAGATIQHAGSDLTIGLLAG